MTTQLFEEELNVRCSRQRFSGIKSRLLAALKNSPMIREIIDCALGVDRENEYNLELPTGDDGLDQDATEVNTVTISFSVGANVTDLDKLSDEVYSCVLYALNNSQTLDFFSLLSPLEEERGIDG